MRPVNEVPKRKRGDRRSSKAPPPHKRPQAYLMAQIGADVAIGTLVRIHSLTSKPELNGQVGSVVGMTTENGRIPVQVAPSIDGTFARKGSSQRIALKPCNYIIVACHNAAPPEVETQTASLPPAIPVAPADPPQLDCNDGYPQEEVVLVFDPATQEALVPPQKKELQKLAKALPLGKRLFEDVAAAQRARANMTSSPTTVDAGTFQVQLEMFTWGLLTDFDAGLWKNVLVAGGAVLASLMPPETNYKRLQPLAGNGGAAWLEFDLYHNRRRQASQDAPARTLEQYFKGTRWPTGDIDLFLYGLDEVAARAKLTAILTTIQRTIIKKHGIGNDVCFIKTPNTITVSCGVIGRTIQIILRLYKSKSAILNGFDIDCCCVGFDGQDALITPRCIKAMSTKINMLNLQIRGEAYECRLLKYVERGFAIGLPQLDSLRRDREHLAFELEENEWGEGETLASDGWDKWSRSVNLERLLMAESLGRLTNGVIERAFPGRQRKDTGRERVLQMSLRPYPSGAGPVRDSYPSRDKAGNPIWPATTKLEAIKRGEPPFDVQFLEGNMPRKPMGWDEWAATAYMPKEGDKPRDQPWRYDPAKYEERAAQEKAKREQELTAARREAAAEAAAEAEAAKQETLTIKLAAAETEAELKRAKREEEAKARQLAIEKARALQQLAKAREAKEKLEEETDAERAMLELKLARTLEAKESLEGEVEDKLCCVCSDAKKSVMFMPCRHISVCEACAAKVDVCPLCRQKAVAKIEAFL